MKKRTISGKARALMAAPAGATRRRRGTQKSLAAAVPARQRSGALLAESPAPDLALAANRKQLIAALRLTEALRAQATFLSEQVVLLAHAVAQAHRFATRDDLTGLPNRRLLMDRCNQAVALAARQHRQVALLFLDLDGFKRINDALGHAAGDGILQQVAARLVACIRTSDTACRYGGDEFVILLPEYEGQQSALAAIDKIRAHLALPFDCDGAAISVTASIGMAVYPADGHEYGALIRASDRAMYRNKARAVAAPGDLGARLSIWRRANGIDGNEEHRDENRQTDIHARREETRSGTGRRLQ
jgi:diguanylate cyclase (GGDEF)-like protein